MNERDCYHYWAEKGYTGEKLIARLKVVAGQIPKTLTAKSRRRRLAECTSLIKAMCYESGIRWAHMGLHEHTWMQE